MASARYAKVLMEKAKQGKEKEAGELGTKAFYLPATEIGFAPNPDLLDRSDEIRNIGGRVVGAQNDLAPSGSVVCRGYASYLGALLYLLFGEVTTVETNGTTDKDPEEVLLPKKAFKHTFKKKPGSFPRTAEITTAYYDKWLKARGTALQSLAFALEDDGVKATGQFLSNYLYRLTVDPADVVTQDAFSVLPWRRRNVTVTTPSLTATALTSNVDFSMEQSLEGVRPLGNPSGFPEAMERANSPEGFLRLQGSLTRRDFDAADWDALVAASIFGLQFKLASEQNIPGTEGGNYPYSLFVKTSGAQFTGGGPETLKEQARHESSYDWQAGSTEAGKDDFEVVLINATKSYTE